MFVCHGVRHFHVSLLHYVGISYEGTEVYGLASSKLTSVESLITYHYHMTYHLVDSILLEKCSVTRVFV